jgi:hypothetical protein
MGTVVSLRELRRLAVTNRCLARADQSILRQLHLVSELHRQRANLDFAASILTNMLVARHLILKRRAQIEREKGQPYLVYFVMPNFYFHCTTCDILRHCAVELGKRDFIGTI